MSKPTEHLRQTLAALARLLGEAMKDIEAAESEFQTRIAQVTQESEQRIAQAAQEAEQRIVQATQEAEHRVIQANKEAENRVAQANREAEQRVAQATREVEQRVAQANQQAQVSLEQQITDRLKHAENQSQAQWQAEREQLVAEHRQAIIEADEAAAIALDLQVTSAVERVRAELKLEGERSIQVAADREAEYRQTIKKLQGDLDAAVELAETAAAQPAVVQQGPMNVGSIHAEVARVEDLIKAATQLIDNPDAELSVVIRKNAERAELESYLRGVRFSIPAE